MRKKWKGQERETDEREKMERKGEKILIDRVEMKRRRKQMMNKNEREKKRQTESKNERWVR